MKKFIFVFALLLLASSAFAVNINVDGQSIAPPLINTNGTYPMLSLTFNATTDSANITAINVTLTATNMSGNTVTANVSGVELRNETLDIIGFNNTWDNVTNSTQIFIQNGFNVSSSANRTLYIYFRINRNATEYLNISANITNFGILTSNSADNISISSANSTKSNGSLILDVHADAAMSPNVVDTYVINQSFILNITITGQDPINRTIITLPSEFTNLNITNLTVNGGSYSSYCPTPGNQQYCENIGGSKINITFSSGGLPKETKIQINFTANTSSPVSTKVNITVDSSTNLTDIPTDQTINIETKQIINSTTVSVSKGSAVVNGTDYWEFNFSLSFSANVSGILQFKMNDWNSQEGYRLNITNSSSAPWANTTTRYATLRESGSSVFYNVTTDYNLSYGIPITVTAASMKYLVLRMIIPSGTPISSTWWTTYWMVFRQIP